MARCIVIGGNGFLGSSVADELVEGGHEVTVFDRYRRGDIRHGEGVRRVIGDVSSESDLDAALAGQDYLFHFLSTSTPASAEDDPAGEIRSNLAGTVALLDLAVARGVSRVFFASTGGAMYGDNQEPVTEGAVPAPVSPYAIGKLAIEGYLRFYQRTRGLESISLRISNPYGPRQGVDRRQGVIPIFLDRIARGLPIDVWGDGSTVRDYLYAPDMARMIASTVDRDSQFPVYNIGSGQGTRLDDLIALLGEVTGREVAIVRHPQPATFVESVVLNIDRFVEEFGERPRVALREGLVRTWAELGPTS